MSVETTTYIDGLNSALPASGDPKSEGDDHLRTIKGAIKATWPNVAGAVTPTHTELNYVDGVTSAIQTQLDAKAPLASPTFTGVVTIPSGASIAGFAPLASPAFTGTPTAPTATTGTATTQVATTAFVAATALNSALPGQTGNAGKLLTTDGTNASWTAVSPNSLAGLSAATAANTIANGDNAQTWQWSLTTAAKAGFKLTELAAATSGAGSQFLIDIGTLAASTANPLRVQTRGVDTLNISRTGDVTVSALSGTTGGGTTGSVVAISGGQGASTSAGGAVTITTGAGGATSGAAGDLNLNLGTSADTAANAGKLSSNATKIALGGTIAAGVAYQTAIGYNSGGQGSVTATNMGTTALGGSYASGVDSFAVAIGSNSATFGAQGGYAISMGLQSKATTTGGVAIGRLSASTGVSAVAISGGTSFGAAASGTNSVAIGDASKAAQAGKYAYTGTYLTAQGDAQYGLMVLRAAPASGTTGVLTSDASAAGSTNQLIVASGQAMTVTGMIVGKVTGTAQVYSATFTAQLINNGGTVTLGAAVTLANVTDGITLTTAPTVTADNTNKGLAITSGAKTATVIKWVATVQSCEITY